MRAALEALVARADGARTVAILGEMAELGPDARRWHAEIGAYAAELGVDLLVAIGPLARAYGGICLEDAEALPNLLQPGDVVLLKGSRSARLERLVPAVLYSEATSRRRKTRYAARIGSPQ
jgi:UDP-N-acetylmuramyl pentapeptide synthase